MNLGLEGRAILIVGASAGLGAATARLLVAEGARVGVVARRAEALEAIAGELRLAGGAVLTFAGDAHEPGFLDRVVRETSHQFGALNGLAVVAAPMGARAAFLDLRDDDWEFYFRAGTMLTVRACRAAIPELVKHPGSAIVLTSAYSIRAQKPDLVAYTAMKTSVAAIAKNLAKSHGGQGLRVNCIAPGVIEKSVADSAMLAQRYGVAPERARYEHVHRQFGMNVALERAGRHEEFAVAGYDVLDMCKRKAALRASRRHGTGREGGRGIRVGILRIDV